MPTAFVLVNTETGSESDVLREFKGIVGIEEATIAYGSYDIILRIAFKSLEELKRTVTWKIRKVEKITSTQTMIVF